MNIWQREISYIRHWWEKFIFGFRLIDGICWQWDTYKIFPVLPLGYSTSRQSEWKSKRAKLLSIRFLLLSLLPLLSIRKKEKKTPQRHTNGSVLAGVVCHPVRMSVYMFVHSDCKYVFMHLPKHECVSLPARASVLQNMNEGLSNSSCFYSFLSSLRTSFVPVQSMCVHIC